MPKIVMEILGAEVKLVDGRWETEDPMLLDLLSQTRQSVEEFEPLTCWPIREVGVAACIAERLGGKVIEHDYPEPKGRVGTIY